jgi:hypothetical protein
VSYFASSCVAICQPPGRSPSEAEALPGMADGGNRGDARSNVLGARGQHARSELESPARSPAPFSFRQLRDATDRSRRTIAIAQTNRRRPSDRRGPRAETRGPQCAFEVSMINVSCNSH